jgi:hypothetical protein
MLTRLGDKRPEGLSTQGIYLGVVCGRHQEAADFGSSENLPLFNSGGTER